MITICAHGYAWFVGKQQWWLVEEQLSARSWLQQVQTMNLKVECPERYPKRYSGVVIDYGNSVHEMQTVQLVLQLWLSIKREWLGHNY